jgi:hypothetical protein
LDWIAHRARAPSGFLGATRVVGGASDGSIAARVVVARCCRGFTAIRVANIEDVVEATIVVIVRRDAVWRPRTRSVDRSIGRSTLDRCNEGA